MYDALKNKNLFNFDESIARDIFTDREFPWEVLPHIGEFILTLGAGLPADEYEQKGENIWIARSATIAPTASINGPCIIGKKRRDPPVCLHPRQCHCGRELRCRKLHGIKKCHSL